jgi:hypothetical protein
MIDDEIAARMVALLQNTAPFWSKVTVTNRPMETLWWTLNDTDMQLRMPLYHRRLGKREPKPADRQTAIQSSLAILGAFAAVIGTRQAVLSSEGGHITSISFQPRPFGVNWTAEHAISCLDFDPLYPALRAMHVEVPDILHLARKVVHVIAGCQAGQMVDAVTTFAFQHTPLMVNVLIRETSGRLHQAELLPN